MKLCPTCQCCFEDEVATCPRPGHAPLTLKRPGSPLIQNKYRLERLLGAGGMGTVYRCIHVELNYPYAIKILLADWASADPHARQRMRREALIACRLDHHNLVRVHDCGTNIVVVEGEEGGQRYEEFFLVMELLDGESLRDYLLKRGALPLEEAVSVARQMASGLSELHSRGVLHRDVKPANVMLKRDHEGGLTVKIVDLGAVKFVERSLAFDDVDLTGEMMVGTARYTSPENCRGLPLDERSDIYCLGLILYEMLAGFPPFDSRDRVDLIYKHAYAEPRSLAEACPSVPESVVRLVMSSLDKRPEARPQSAAEFAQALLKLEPAGRADAPHARRELSDVEADETTHVVAGKVPSPHGVRDLHADDSDVSAPTPGVGLASVDEEVVGFDLGSGGSGADGVEVDSAPSETVLRLPAAGRRASPSERKRIALALTYFLAFAMTALFLVWSLLSKESSAARVGVAPHAETPSETQAGDAGDVFITTTDVNMRSGPRKSSPKVGLAEEGSRVRVISSDGHWREVRVLRHGRPKEDEASLDEGWLDGGLLRPPDD